MEVLDPLIDSLADKIRNDYYADPNKMFTNQQFEDNIDSTLVIIGLPGGNTVAGLKPFITNRRDSLWMELADYGCYEGLNDNAFPAGEVSVFPNPVTGIVYAEVNYKDGSFPDYYTLSDITGRKISAGNFHKSSVSIDCTEIKSGTYFLNIDNKIFNKILIIH